jgi:isopenicillin N synthase-like dioxygenase
VLNANGHFTGVPPIPNTLVLNVDDFLERATNHVFSSTIHRVIHLADVDRYSLAYFFDADLDAMIDIVDLKSTQENTRV